MSVENVVAIMVSGLVLGSIYSLMASGLSLVWGTLRIFNFAHGAVLALGAYVAWTVTSVVAGSLGLLVGAIVGMVAAMLVGLALERWMVRPFVDRPGGDLVAMITTLAAATLIQNLIQVIWGPRLKQLPEVATGTISILGTSISYHDLAVIVLAPLILLSVRWFLENVPLGLAVRAVQQNPDAARLVGIDVAIVYSTTFAVASALAAIAGVLLGAIFFLTPTMGDEPLLKAFVVVVFGGLASLGGTVAGAYVIGLLEAASVFFIGLYLTPAILFLVMIGVMLARPQGLFGRAS